MLEREIRSAARRVLTSPARLRFLRDSSLDDGIDFARFLYTVVPLAQRSLAKIESLAERIPDDRLRHEALASIGAKAYHVAGASILATFLPQGAREHYIDIVAPLETIYDFLDNLCDRHPDVPPEAYPQLHLALADALDTAAPLHEYYLYGPSGDDGDYLRSLVRRVRRNIARIAEHDLALPYFRKATTLYTKLQTYKHLPPGEREAACIAWYEREHDRDRDDLSWWEFACAAGSQFHVYGALYELMCSDYRQIGPAYYAYYPAFGALHVLLDYFIDQDEDDMHGELNFVDCYGDLSHFRTRARILARRARYRFAFLPMPRAHELALRVMCLFYLSHPKVFEQGLGSEAAALLEALS